MPLDSDIDNPDSRMSVTFYISKEKGYEGVPFVNIQTPGDTTNIVDTPVREDHKQRFTRQWLYFQMQNDDAPVVGTALMEWHRERPNELSDHQMAELGILKFQTVEQIATASDRQLQRIGMGAEGLRTLAQAFVRGRNAAQSSKELDETKALLKAQGEQMAAMAAQMNALMTGQTTEAPVRNKGGRPRKVVGPIEATEAV